MTLSAAALRKMLEMGLTADQMVELAEVLEHDLERAPSAATTAESETSRQSRNRRYYENRKAKEEAERLKASENASESASEHTSYERLKASESVLNSDAPRARGLEPPLRLLDNDTIRDFGASERAGLAADGWPEADPGEHLTATWTKRLMAVCGPRMADPTKDGRLAMSSTAMAQWRKAGCSWADDVVPTVRALTQSTGQKIKTWGFFTEAILEQAARSRAALTIPDQPESYPHERPYQASRHSTRPSRTSRQLEKLADVDAAMRAAVRN